MVDNRKRKDQKRISSQKQRDIGNTYFRKVVRTLSTKLVVSLIKEEIGCMKCGDKNIPNYALDFHHIGEKKHCFGSLISMGIMDTLLDEIQKCVILCANCHRGEHHANNRIRIW